MLGRASNCAMLVILALTCVSMTCVSWAQHTENSAGVSPVSVAPEIGGRREDARAPQVAWTSTCPAAPVKVAAASPEERELVCQAAAEAIRLLARCQISPQRLMHVEISDVVRNPFGSPIFGRFDAGQEIAFVTRYAQIASLTEQTPYSEISPADFYKSLVVHELVHGVMHQNYRRSPMSRAAWEYPAYAIQLASLPPNAREKFLHMINSRSSKGDLLFNDIILAFDPYFFAARAYEHFTGGSGGCSQVRALLEGEVQFIATLQ